MIEMTDHAAERAGGGERADVGFQKNCAAPRQAFPIVALPIEAMIDHFTGPIYIVGLKAGCRIGNFDAAVDLEAVARARPGVSNIKFEPIAPPLHCDRPIKNKAYFACRR